MTGHARPVTAPFLWLIIVVTKHESVNDTQPPAKHCLVIKTVISLHSLVLLSVCDSVLGGWFSQQLSLISLSCMESWLTAH